MMMDAPNDGSCAAMIMDVTTMYGCLDDDGGCVDVVCVPSDDSCVCAPMVDVLRFDYVGYLTRLELSVVTRRLPLTSETMPNIIVQSKRG